MMLGMNLNNGSTFDVVVLLPVLLLVVVAGTFAAWHAKDKKRREDRLAARARMRGSL